MIGPRTYSFQSLYKQNSIVTVSNKFKHVLLADDTDIVLPCNTTNNVENIVNIIKQDSHVVVHKYALYIFVNNNFMVFDKRKCSFVPKIAIDKHQAESTYCVIFLGEYNTLSHELF